MLLISLIDWNTSRDHMITMFHHLQWPDGADPQDPLTLFEMIHSLRKMNPYCTVVHGCAGAGRTGTFIALLHLMNQIHSRAKHLNVFQTVLELRKDRKFMVRQIWPLRKIHCKSSSRNLSGFYSCPSAICSPVVFYGIIRCTQRIFVTFTTQREARIATQKM